MRSPEKIGEEIEQVVAEAVRGAIGGAVERGRQAGVKPERGEPSSWS